MCLPLDRNVSRRGRAGSTGLAAAVPGLVTAEEIAIASSAVLPAWPAFR